MKIFLCFIRSFCHQRFLKALVKMLLSIPRVQGTEYVGTHVVICCTCTFTRVQMHASVFFNPPMVWPFKICLLAKWLSIFLNLLKHSIIFCYCTTTPFNTLWNDLKGRQIGLWYNPMIKVCLFRELFHLSKPFMGPFCQTVF